MTHINLGSDLLNYIASSGLKPGDFLPTIHTLADEEHLNISPSKVREQLEVARMLEWVEVRSKTGTRLKDFDFAPVVRLALLYAMQQDPGYFDWFSALRIEIEAAFWHEACNTLDEAALSIMRRCLEDARQKLDAHPIRIPNLEHRTFHLSIFNNVENPFVRGMLHAYWDAYDAVEPNRYADYEYLRKVWDYHQKIYDHICAGEYEESRLAFLEHTLLLRYKHHPPLHSNGVHSAANRERGAEIASQSAKSEP